MKYDNSSTMTNLLNRAAAAEYNTRRSAEKNRNDAVLKAERRRADGWISARPQDTDEQNRRYDDLVAATRIAFDRFTTALADRTASDYDTDVAAMLNTGADELLNIGPVEIYARTADRIVVSARSGFYDVDKRSYWAAFSLGRPELVRQLAAEYDDDADAVDIARYPMEALAAALVEVQNARTTAPAPAPAPAPAERRDVAAVLDELAELVELTAAAGGPLDQHAAPADDERQDDEPVDEPADWKAPLYPYMGRGYDDASVGYRTALRALDDGEPGPFHSGLAEYIGTVTGAALNDDSAHFALGRLAGAAVAIVELLDRWHAEHD